MSVIEFVSKPADETAIGEVQSIPCHIEYTGVAKVSAYMQRDRIDDTTERSTFRGRCLEGNCLSIPIGYRLYVMRESDQLIDDIKTMEIHSSRSNFILWNYDRKPSTKDTIRRAIDYLQIANAFAADD
jgi:hypothetical protein